jgi:hypothetical protein
LSIDPLPIDALLIDAVTRVNRLTACVRNAIAAARVARSAWAGLIVHADLLTRDGFFRRIVFFTGIDVLLRETVDHRPDRAIPVPVSDFFAARR